MTTVADEDEVSEFGALIDGYMKGANLTTE